MNGKIFNLNKKREEIENEGQFIDFLDKDIENGKARRMPESVFNRIARIKNKAYLARERNEQVEM